MRRLLVEITDHSLGLDGGIEALGERYRLRKSARVVLLNDDNQMAVQHLSNHAYHKLPGGGVESGESLSVTAKREILEEVGCQCNILSEIGMVIEYRNIDKLLHISYCFVAQVDGKVGEPTLEQAEVNEGQVTKWLPATEVLAMMKSDQPQIYKAHFILKREISFLEEYLSQF